MPIGGVPGSTAAARPVLWTEDSLERHLIVAELQPWDAAVTNLSCHHEAVGVKLVAIRALELCSGEHRKSSPMAPPWKLAQRRCFADFTSAIHHAPDGRD
jgi:hypothetical protein